jgi:hypothetical protein
VFVCADCDTLWLDHHPKYRSDGLPLCWRCAQARFIQHWRCSRCQNLYPEWVRPSVSPGNTDAKPVDDPRYGQLWTVHSWCVDCDDRSRYVPVERTARPCEHCGQEFTPARSHARYCGSKCRGAAHRAKAPTG